MEGGPIGFRAASFTWGANSGDTSLQRRQFCLTIEDEVFFKRGCINLIIGQTGCGKTSMLMALLGEMHYIPLNPSSLVNLPRDKGIAYHAQESWVLNETIKVSILTTLEFLRLNSVVIQDNILFGSQFDSERYAKVIKQCALERDLDLFEAGDETEVGERGVTLR